MERVASNYTKNNFLWVTEEINVKAPRNCENTGKISFRHGVVRNNFPSEVCLDWPLNIMHHRLVLIADITIRGCFNELPSVSLISDRFPRAERTSNIRFLNCKPL